MGCLLANISKCYNTYMKDMKIITIKGPNNSKVSFCPERGGLIISLVLNKKEIFYFDEETFKNKKESIRGGIPILFPNMGELNDESIYQNLKRHGFARDLGWKTEEIDKGFKEILLSNKETKKIYPFDFKFSNSGLFESDGTFTLIQEIENKEETKEMPISMGLHPYFKVPSGEKKNIKFNFEGGKYIEEQINSWGNGETLYIDNPKIINSEEVLEIDIPGLGKLVIDISTQYKKIWIWSMPGKDFICIEPAMMGQNGLIDSPFLIEPNGKFKASFSIKLK
jgi:glucose-6-phosphate 1-epimerase